MTQLTSECSTPFAANFGSEAAQRAISEMARAMQPSSILTIAHEIRTLKEQDIPVADMTVGDFSSSEFPIPTRLRELIHEMVDAGQTNYPPATGLKELREAVQKHIRRTQQLSYPLESIVIVGGARPALYSYYRILTDPGDTVLFPVPSWNNQNYRDVCGLQAEIVTCGPQTAFQPTAELLEPHIRKPRLLVLNTPQNPSGGVMRATEVEKIGRLIVSENKRREQSGEKPLYCILDQIYRALVLPGSEHVSPVQLVPECAPYIVHVDGMSKFCAATGLRVGWLVAPPLIAQKATALLTHVGAWAPRPAQAASAAFLNDSQVVAEWEQTMLGRIQERIQPLYEGLMELQNLGYPVDAIAPQGAIYISTQIDIQGRATATGEVLQTSEDVRRYLLSEAAFALVPFAAFGVPADDEHGWFRASVGAVSPADIHAAIPRLRAALDKLQ